MLRGYSFPMYICKFGFRFKRVTRIFRIKTNHTTWDWTKLHYKWLWSVVLSQLPRVLWASGCWHYERTLYSRRPLKGTEVSIYLWLWSRLYSTTFAYSGSMVVWKCFGTLNKKLHQHQCSLNIPRFGTRSMMGNNWLKFRILGGLPITWKEFIENISN